MSDNTALMAVASRLHLFLRRKSNRLTDVVWMTVNADYAREVLRLVRAESEAEMSALASRFEELMPSAGPVGITRDESPPREGDAEPRPGRDYIRTLR